MAKLEFRIDVEKQPVDELYESIDKLEKQAKKLQTTDLGLDNWTRQFEKFKRELKGKADEIEVVKNKITSFNSWDDKKGLDNLTRQLNKLKKDYDTLTQTAVDTANKFRESFTSISAALSESKKNVNDVTERLIRQKAVVADLRSEIRGLNEASGSAGQNDTAAGEISSKEVQLENERAALDRLRAKQEQAKSTLESFRNEISNYQESLSGTADGQDKTGFSLKNMLISVAGSTTLTTLATDIVRVRGEFQQFSGYFTTLLQSKEKANDLMTQMAETAVKTPFSLTEVATGAQQLITYGFAAEDVNDILLRLGNVASGSGVPLERLTSLYGTTMEQGRLYASDLAQFTASGIPMLQGLADMYGVSTEEIDKMVSSGTIGFTQVQQVMEEMTNKGGRFYNMMEEESQTITGKINNLSDSWEDMLNKIGQSQDGIINGALDGLGYLIDNYESLLGVMISLAAGYGSYRAALMTVAAIQGVVKASTVAMSSAEAAHILVNKQLTKATELLKLAQLSLPYVAIAAAVAGLVYVLYKLVTAESAAEKAQREYKERKEQIIELEQKHKEEVNGLIDTATNQYLTDFERVAALEELKGKYPEIFKEYDIEKLKLADILDFKNKIVEADRKRVAQDRDKYASYLRESILTKYGIKEDYLKDHPDATHSNTIHYYKKRLSQSELNEYSDNLKLVEAEAQKDRVTEWIGNLKNLTDEQIQAGLEARERLISELKNTEDTRQIIDSNQNILGSFTAEELKSQTENLQVEIRRRNQTVYTYVELEKKYQKDLVDAQKELRKLSSSKSTYKEDDWLKMIKEAKDKEDAAKKALSTLSAKKEGKTTPPSDDQQQKLEKERSIHSQLLDLRAQNEQDEVSQMKDGTEKRLAQIELDYDREIAAIQAKEKEWRDAQGGKLTDEQNTEIVGVFKHAWVKKDQSTAEQENIEKQANNDYLKEYGTYLQKRQAITDLYNDKIAKATTEGEKLSLGKELTKSLSTLDIEANKTTAAISQLFGDMSKSTVTSMRVIADQGEEALQFLKGGQWDATTGAKLGISEDTFKTLSTSPEEMEKIGKAITDVRAQADQCDTAFNQMGIGLQKMFSSNGDEVKLAEGMAILQAGMGKAMQAGQFLSGTLSSLGDALGSDTLTAMAEGLNVAMDAADAAMKGAQAGAMFGPMGMAAGAAVGAVTSLVSSFAKLHDAKYEKRIQEMQKEVDNLGRAYDRLGRAIDNTYSNAVYGMMDQQAENLKRQQQLVLQQKREEEAKKKTDKQKTQEYDDKYEELGNQAEDLRKKQIEMLAGTDVQSAIDDFADALVEAYAQGADGAEAMGEVTKKVLANAVKEALKKQLLGDALKNAVTRLGEDMEDGSLSDEDKRRFENSAQSAGQRFMEAMKMYDELFKGEGESEGEAPREAAAKGIASMSQESADLLNGQFTTQLIYLDRTCTEVTGIREQMAFIHELQVRGWEDVKAIRDMSGRIVELSDRIATVSDKIEVNTGWTARGIQDINDKGVLMRGR